MLVFSCILRWKLVSVTAEAEFARVARENRQSLPLESTRRQVVEALLQNWRNVEETPSNRTSQFEGNEVKESTCTDSRAERIKTVLSVTVLEEKSDVTVLRKTLTKAAADTVLRRSMSLLSKTRASIRSSMKSIRSLESGNCPQECVICLDSYESGESIAWGKADQCHHIFHEECISLWLLQHDECPLCRTNLFEYTDGEDKGNLIET